MFLFMPVLHSLWHLCLIVLNLSGVFVVFLLFVLCHSSMWLTLSVSPAGWMELRLHCHSALHQPVVEEELVEQQVAAAPEAPRAHLEAWPSPSGSTTWPPVTSTSPTTSCGATSTGRRRSGLPPTASVGSGGGERRHLWIWFAIVSAILLTAQSPHFSSLRALATL